VSSLVGRTLSHYEIVEEISRGGMGVVYRARDSRLHRDVALKVLPPELISDPARRERFAQEARAASALEHPHIAVIHAIDEVDGISFIAMELVRGDKLSDVLARGPLTPPRALELATEIAEGLARAHDKGVVHRDLKPANVMLTEDGHAKIIDFGLAKLIDALSGDADGQTVLKNETDPGMVLGTASYMSPEQARGAKVDHRSDVFSFGVLLHEMLTGRPPFRGNTGIDTMHAILHDPAPPLPPLGGTVTDDVQRILDKCLAKDPAERYQGMRDVVVDLRATRRRLDSAPHGSAVAAAAKAVTTRDGFMRAQQWAYGGVALVVLALASFGFLRARWTGASTTSATAPTPNAKPSVAVLYFENNTGNPQLDWLRTGLTDMLVTDLSQSPDVEVLGTDRLVQILGDMKRQDDRQISFDTVQEIAKRAHVSTVVLGSYVKAGDTLRINIKMQEPSTGRIVTSERVEANGDTNLFPTVDDLTKRIKAKFMVSGSIDPTKGLITSPIVVSTTTGNTVDRDLKDVTTSSIEAYRYYAEGINLHERQRDREAIPLLEKAIEIDPNFAMALTKLSVVHNNLLHSALARDYAKRAFEHVDRLTTRERYYVEGNYYWLDGAALDKAIQAFSKAIELYPDHASARNNLALLYFQIERYDEAIRHFELLTQRGMTFTGTYGLLEAAYMSVGQSDKAYAVAREYVDRNADNAQGYLQFGGILARGGRFDEALAAFDKAQALDPANPVPKMARRAVYVVREQWADVDTLERALQQNPDVSVRVNAWTAHGTTELLRGHASNALQAFESAAREAGPRGGNIGAVAHGNIATLLLERGDTSAALAEAERSYEMVIGTATGLQQGGVSQVLIGVAQAKLSRESDLQQTIARLQEQASRNAALGAVKRAVHLLNGRIALERHDVNRAIQDLRTAESMLPPVPPGVGATNIWFALGSAYVAAGNDAEAASRFQRIVDSGIIRVPTPIDYVRSLYYLGQISERKGDRAKAGEYYRKFLQYWGDGDLDRERVAEARKKLGTT
jgi:tetratricopeptide (TPR) repeat protein/TolB-like protein/tRNA A-37 threonylcarbamoyl transferase component Bud32